MATSGKQTCREPYPHLLPAHIRSFRNAPLPVGCEAWAVHRDLYYLMIATGRRYDHLFDLDATEIHLHPGYGPYIQIGGHGRKPPIVIPLWVFPGAAAIIEKYRDHNQGAFWLLDKTYQTSQEEFMRIIRQITATIPGFPYRLTSAHAMNTFVFMFYSHQDAFHLLSAMTGITAKWLQPTFMRMEPAQVLRAAEGLYFQELETVKQQCPGLTTNKGDDEKMI